MEAEILFCLTFKYRIMYGRKSSRRGNKGRARNSYSRKGRRVGKSRRKGKPIRRARITRGGRRL